jgi:prolyl-tRNA editing enzyme YbaK/EbsC (Cys-tRNA(Pro) deacylase)
MSVQSVRKLFSDAGLGELVLYSKVVSDTVENAAAMIGCEPCQIAKTMSFLLGDVAIVIVASGDAKIDNGKYKAEFGAKAKMIPYGEAEHYTGHLPGGICPFALKENVAAFLDESLKRFDVVYTGGGDEHNTVKVTIPQLEQYSNYQKWIDVCKNWND